MTREDPAAPRPTPLVAIRLLAERWGVTRRFLLREIAEGRLKAHRLGPRSYRVALSDAEGYLRQRRVEPRAAAQRAAIERRVAEITAREETVKRR